MTTKFETNPTNSVTDVPCEHVQVLQKATLDWLIHDVIRHHPFSFSGGFVIGAFLLVQVLRKAKGK